MPPCCTLYEHVPKPIFTIGITDIAIEQPRRHSNVSTQATQLLKTSTGEVRNAMFETESNGAAVPCKRHSWDTKPRLGYRRPGQIDVR